jgi:predicted ATPase
MINRLYVHNFRCLENFELPIAGKPSALLIGKNGSGKSTVLSALEVLRSVARGVDADGRMLRASDLIGPADFARGRFDVPIRFELEAVIGGEVYAFNVAFELPAGSREPQIRDEELTVGGRLCYSRNTFQLGAALGETGADAQTLDAQVFALPLFQQRAADPAIVFRSWLRRMLLLAPIPGLMHGRSEPPMRWSPRKDCSDLAAWLSAILVINPPLFTRMESYLKDVMSDFLGFSFDRGEDGQRSLTVQFEKDRARLDIDFQRLSDGEKCFFVAAGIAPADATFGPAVCFWDEPDNYLAPDEVGHFVMELRRQFQSGGQLLVTSHNVEAIRKFSDDDTLVLYRRSHLEPTLVRPLEEIGYSGDLGRTLVRGDLEP